MKVALYNKLLLLNLIFASLEEKKTEVPITMILYKEFKLFNNGATLHRTLCVCATV